jgi:Glu-tRNA(Gln) amidotransferase subunit E-like FAD-binding protein
VIFNYVAADIKNATKFSKNINQAINFDSYAITAVELYKVNNLRSSDILNTGYRYSIEPIDSSTLLVNILKNSELYANYIVQYGIDLGSINKIVGNPVEFKADNKYNNTLIAAETSRIDVNANKIFNTLILAPNTQITGTDGSSIDSNTDFLKYANNLITDIDIPNLNQALNQYISSYYRNYYQALYNKYFDQLGNLKNGVALYEDNNIVFTNE